MDLQIPSTPQSPSTPRKSSSPSFFARSPSFFARSPSKTGTAGFRARVPDEAEQAVLTGLQRLITTRFEEATHVPLLRKLWASLHPDGQPFERTGREWKRVGFQHSDRASDVRGGGEPALRNLEYFAAAHADVALPMMERLAGTEPLSDGTLLAYPWATAGVNLTQLIGELFSIVGPHGTRASFECSSQAHWGLLRTDPENAFNELYCTAFVVLDSLFVEMAADYLRFPEVCS